MPVDPRKVRSVVEWATPTSCAKAHRFTGLRFTGLANYYRRFVEGSAEPATPSTALGSPTARFASTAVAQDALKQAD